MRPTRQAGAGCRHGPSTDRRVSTLQVWDDYEWSWTGSLSQWALDHPEHPDNGEALKAAAEHRHTWLHGYRGTLGFVTLLLRRTNC
ncbi:MULTISPECIES: hypothetical protein [Streptomyces]|uniref:hypothetical protein n=1 Tax=Streptomyces TaxID=1883 RepID=UPI0027BB0BFC|nr:hypothetical protein [Streptomyces fildesensis]